MNGIKKTLKIFVHLWVRKYQPNLFGLFIRISMCVQKKKKKKMKIDFKREENGYLRT